MIFRVDSYERALKEKESRLRKWHRWFAWKPVRINDRQIAWFEIVMRCGKRTQVYRATTAGTPHLVWRWIFEYRERWKL